MDETDRVDRIEPGGDLSQEAERRAHARTRVRLRLGERAPVDPLHDEERRVLRAVQPVDDDHVRMSNRREDAGLSLERGDVATA